jgi:signal transduction histidine kinase
MFRRQPLQSVITREALGDAEVLPFLHLDWEGGGDPSYAYQFAHTFDAPFGDWRVTASLAPLSGSSLRPMRYILLWSVLVGVVVLVGLTKTYRTLVQSMEYARQRDNFVAAVSHELKSPLTAIRMYSEMLREGLVGEDARRQQYYETIHGESERLSRLVDDVLTYSRLEGGRREADVAGSVSEGVESVTSLFEPYLAETGRQLRVEVDPAAAEGRVDRDALAQVLTNLLDNAFKFSAETDAPVSLAVTRKGDAVVLRVRDHGPGVAPAILRTMFEPFVRGEDELVRQTKGTGLGLALVQGLVENAGGSVRATNHPDGGLEVIVTLPWRDPPAV